MASYLVTTALIIAPFLYGFSGARRPPYGIATILVAVVAWLPLAMSGLRPAAVAGAAGATIARGGGGRAARPTGGAVAEAPAAGGHRIAGGTYLDGPAGRHRLGVSD